MKLGDIPSEIELKKKNLELQKKLSDLGMDSKEVKNLLLIHEKNILIDKTKGIQYLDEIMEMVKDGFKSIMDEGPMGRESCIGLKVSLMDAELHEDPVHRGPGQILPPVRAAIKAGILDGGPALLEPMQIIRIDVPTEVVNGALREVQNRRGKILDMTEERGASILQAKIPVAEMFGFDSALKSATGGKGFYSLIDVIFEKLPKELQEQVILKIRKRKGLSEEVPTVE
jgi:elongation factor 2